MQSDIPPLILSGIRTFAASRPRSLQREVGPSGLGNPCDHCLAAALAGWEKQEQDTPWLPLIGTAVHELLLTHEVFGDGWLKEHRVTVGTVGGLPVLGNADLYHAPTGTVIDLKIVGASTLNEAQRHGSKAQYRRQINLYGKGFEDNYGYDVTTTIIAYLPRNSPRLSDAFFDVQPYDRTIAEEALKRANDIAATMDELNSIVGYTARDIYIDGLPRAAGCYDCARYPSIIPRVSELQEFATNG
jgi:hypothetical protein